MLVYRSIVIKVNRLDYDLVILVIYYMLVYYF